MPAGLAGGRAYLDHIVLKQNVTRYANPWHHRLPWYYYLTVIPPEFLPWSFFLPTAVVAARGVGGRERSGLRLWACWAVVTVVFFSLSPAKRDVYVLTMYAAMALLVGAGLDAQVVGQQALDLGAEPGLAAAGVLQEGVAVAERQVGRPGEQGPDSGLSRIDHGSLGRRRRAIPAPSASSAASTSRSTASPPGCATRVE